MKPASEEVLAELNSIIDVVFFLQPIAIALETMLRNRLELVLFIGPI